MPTIDQNSATLALESSLIPRSNLIDGRTETDHLRALADVATLINFYDASNAISGDWQPFLLKDPVFLVSYIAKTVFKEPYKLFANTCLQLQSLLANNGAIVAISNAFNQVFDQILGVIQLVEYWTQYMLKTDVHYKLKTFVIQQVQQTISALLWALLGLKEQLSIHRPQLKIRPVDTYLYKDYNETVWKASKGKQAYWVLLGFHNPNEDPSFIESISNTSILEAIQSAGNKVWTFFNTCISYAAIELDHLKLKKGDFPDTLLLRTFSSLLQHYNTQMNTLSAKHLSFYYENVLKQAPLSAIGDSAYLALTLTEKTKGITLPKGTQFNAGLSAEKTPILFVTKQAQTLNPAVLTKGYTLNQAKTTFGTTVLSCSETPELGVVKTNDKGIVEPWKTFGTQYFSEASRNAMGTVFASPMLYLGAAENRVITISLTFTEPIDPILQYVFKTKTTYALSTSKAWFPVTTLGKTLAIACNDAQLQITITLQPTDPVIEAFAKAPKNLESTWPMFKMQYSEFGSLEAPPQITALSIKTVVTASQNFQLYNDFGLLNTKKPFQPLGPTPNVNQNFIMGSSELFSKPLKSISLNLFWKPFPQSFNFKNYYEKYNDFLNGAYEGQPLIIGTLKQLIDDLINQENEFFNKLMTSETTFFKSLKTKETKDIEALLTTGKTNLKTFLDTEISKLKNKVSEHKILEAIVGELLGYLEIKILGIYDALLKDIPTLITNESSLFEHIESVERGLFKEITTAERALFHGIEGFIDTHIKDLGAKDKSEGGFQKIMNSVTRAFSSKTPELNEELVFQYSNQSFQVLFSFLGHGVWQPMDMNVSTGVAGTDVTNGKELYYLFEPKDGSISDVRSFSIQKDFTGTPTLQESPLKFSNSSENGFIKLQLVAPEAGFGLELYPKVVGAIALYNAQLLMNHENPLVSPPNQPWTPVVNTFTGDYVAQADYAFEGADNAYPLDCFYQTPFNTFKVYDATEGLISQGLELINTAPKPSTGAAQNTPPVELVAHLPLVPKLPANGVLYLETTNTIVDAELSLYFELASDYTLPIVNGTNISYSYLSPSGWEPLEVISDGTHQFSCSGIIRLYLPLTTVSTHQVMSSDGLWIAIATTNHPDQFPQTSFLDTNGLTVERVMDSSALTASDLQMTSHAISGLHKSVPGIAKTIQPFASFGGVPAEVPEAMNLRVSNRLYTKDRLVRPQDYFNTIRLVFPEVYYSKTVFDSTTKKTCTYLVKRVNSATDPHAFMPLVARCKTLEITEYIKGRTSDFTKIEVSNFEIKYLKMSADITVASGYDVSQIEADINAGINVFLSPWIQSSQEQMTIHSGVDTARIVNFISSFQTVVSVNSIALQLGTKDFSTGGIHYGEPTQQIQSETGVLLVPSLNNLTEHSLIYYHL